MSGSGKFTEKVRTGDRDRGWQGCRVLGGVRVHIYADTWGKRGAEAHGVQGLEAGGWMAQESAVRHSLGWSRVSEGEEVSGSFPISCWPPRACIYLSLLRTLPSFCCPSVLFSFLQLFLISQNKQTNSLQLCQFFNAHFLLQLLLPWYIFLLQLFSNSCSTL